MDGDFSQIMQVLVGAIASGLTLGIGLSVRSNKQQNNFRNTGNISVRGNNNKFNSDNTNITNHHHHGNNPNNNDDGAAILLIGIAALLGAVYVLFWHFDKVELAVNAIAFFAGTAGAMTAIMRYRGGNADQYVMYGALAFAVVGLLLAPEAVAAMKASLVPEAKAIVQQYGVWELVRNNPQYIQYIIFQFFGLFTTVGALAWQVFFAYKQRTLADNLLGYSVPLVVGLFSYFALSGHLYSFLNG